MKPCSLAHWVSVLVAFSLVISSVGEAKDKPIRLRNQVILTHTTNAPNAKPVKDIASGLYLIQFQDSFQPQWRDALRKINVELLTYVPEDAFIAKLDKVSLTTLRAMPFVGWAGEYSPEHKVHASVNRAAKGKPADELLSVSILFSPLATPDEKAQGRRAFQKIQQESHLRQGDIFRGAIPKGHLDRLAQSGAVLWIEPGPKMKILDEVASKIIAGDGGVHATYTQLNGYDGQGVAVAVADSGLDTGDAATMHPDLFGRATDFFYYGALTDASDEHSHGTHVAGIIAGDGAVGEADENDALYGLGVAPKARIITQRIFDGVGNFEAPSSFGVLTRDAVRAGADIGSNSWGDDTQGRYDTSAMEFDALVRDADETAVGDQPYILEFSAGNAGPGRQTMDSPAVGKNVIATGASQNNRFDFFIYADGQDAMADFSSRGPCEDGRIKPDITAPGTWISSLASSYASDENAWAGISSYYLYMGGTSQAGPHASGAAAVFVQYYRQIHGQTPSPALVKAALINSAVDMDNEVQTGPVPNNDEGWGRIDLTELIGSDRIFEFVEQTNRLLTGQTYEHHILVGNGDMPLKFTLTYTDVPGFPGAIPALVNDLDLEVIGPDGKQYHGNQFFDGESVPNPAAYDAINNVEGVHLGTPLSGEYIVRVRARQVAQDAISDTPGVMDQDFALVVSGDLLAPFTSLLVMDRRAYTAPSSINIRLYDFDLAGLSSVKILVRSTTEINGEPLMLKASGFSGVFTGSVATVTGFGVVDGRLQVSDGDTIEAVYEDVSPAVPRIAAALCDLHPPVIQNVAAVNRFGQAVISWDTDEPADGIVLYGTDPQHLTWGLTNSGFSQSHTVTLTNITAGYPNYFYVISTDFAGNTAVDNNGGALYSFVPAPPATVLLVDAYNLEAELFYVPISLYTEALDQIGINYDLWDATTGPTPTIGNLKAYQLVIWRPPESASMSPEDLAALTDYVNGGGSLFIASMELNSRLDESSGTDFRQNVLHVASYTFDQDMYGIRGNPDDLFAAGINATLDFTAYDEYFQFWGNFSDYITPGDGATPVLFETVSGETVGLRYPGTGVQAPGRVVFLSFPLDAIPMSGAGTTRADVLDQMINFLIPGRGGIGTIALDKKNYTLPSTINIEVADSDLKSRGSIQVTVSSTTDSSGQSVTLTETKRLGVFQGTIKVVNATNSPVTGQLRARAGDTILANYYDESLGQTKSDNAIIDVTPAAISAVGAEPGYTDAIISWTTSEPSDSTIQFGKSKLLDRVAYDTALVTDHGLQLIGLDAEQTYYYSVLSRDEAGNLAIDDNGGQFYSFTTLTPMHTPFVDNFDTVNNNWTVYSSDDSEGGWQLGVPANGKETQAHSEPNAWGSNMDGEAASYIESFLISPPILLTGGNRVTLSFYHSYDFTSYSEFDIIEGGTVMIMTNENTEPIALGAFGMDEYSDGWEQATYDLSPYAGQLVHIVWFYQMLSFSWEDVYSRPGWLVDDVSVTTAAVTPGTLIITNNLWQARFDLSGPLSVSGRGPSLVITDAPPGRYVITFNDALYYQTPRPQTNTLVSSGSMTFQGQYTFTDANNNGMPDGWEMQFFGTVSPSRTRATDTDGDGMSDLNEFVAGTDPRVATSKMQITTLQPLDNGTIRIQWASTRDHAYRLEGSNDAKTWTPVSDWIHALSTTTFYVLPRPAPGGPYLFRVVVSP